LPEYSIRARRDEIDATKNRLVDPRRHPAVRGILLDLDGVVYVGDTPLPGSLDAISKMRQLGFD
jgi:hypothetical protein